jgi:hypothetical protein
MLATSLAATMIGLPRQILHSWRSKTTPGNAAWFWWLGCSAYYFRLTYSLYEHVWLIALAAVPGFITFGIAGIQSHVYKKKGAERE